VYGDGTLQHDVCMVTAHYNMMCVWWRHITT